ncbi:unnamed protein product [Soboliphyme baturini]|uniref:RBR-type E3 ubiquitin transferase n=1 Tax=Soboliphyme baturini TaxID=241478 RepID=A0A183IQ18_9BILA|nr:unnamed protein product [Soboliphyme baturini]
MQIMEGNGKIGCPVCSAEIHGNDVYGLLEGNKPILDRYEKLSLRRALAENPNMRWCPAPDCDYGVLAENCDRCPLLYCQRKGCETSFCYICRQQKIDDRCNYMVCSVCGSNFCWLCARETGGGHFIFPSGCPLWGKKRWSKTQRLFWLVATIIVSPAVLALEVTGTILVALFVLPTFVFINKFAHLKQSSALKSSATAAAAFLGQLALAPVFSALAVMNELVGYFKYVLRCIGDLSN